MARRRPTDAAAFADLTGVGGRKLERYADIFLEAIRGYAGA
jgi:ATP-dependent DNA helicase RecQ